MRQKSANKNIICKSVKKVAMAVAFLAMIANTGYCESQSQVCVVTAYTASDDECGKADGITASGVVARAGITAAADHLPFGTIIILPNGERRIIQDRFGGGYDNRIDIFCDTKDEAWDFGRQELRVEIISSDGNER